MAKDPTPSQVATNVLQGIPFRFYYRRPIESLCRDPRGTSESRY